MRQLSIDAINSRAPYKVEQTGENFFMFVTKYKVVYSVGFMQDVSFYKEGVYQFYLNNLSGRTSRVDNDIKETVRVIIEEFFAQEESVMLYICDTTDMRQEYRDRLFKIWFHTYEQNDAYALFSEGMKIDNVHYFSSILLRKDNPRNWKVLQAFHNFVTEHSQEG